jgi:hypothetical protein
MQDDTQIVDTKKLRLAAPLAEPLLLYMWHRLLRSMATYLAVYIGFWSGPDHETWTTSAFFHTKDFDSWVRLQHGALTPLEVRFDAGCSPA